MLTLTRWPRCSAALVLAAALMPSSPLQVGRNQGVLDPNLASREQLLALPHLDDAKVDGLLAQRPILSMTALDAHLGSHLSREQRSELYVKLFLPIDLNTASREEIMLVPGMGKKMAHEFEEYRPYVALAQFRREIGKYVDEAEVARFESYVFVPLDPNSAQDEDILSIPGGGQRLLEALKAHRPYASVEQCRAALADSFEDAELRCLLRYLAVREAPAAKEPQGEG